MTNELPLDEAQKKRRGASHSHTPFTQLLQSILQGDRAEITRVARELEVAENTVYRWLNGTSEPRMAHVKRLPDVFIEHRQAMIDAINQTYGQTIGHTLHHVREVGKEIYLRILELASVSQDEDTRFWNITQALFEYILQHLDSEQLGLAVTYAGLMPPHEDGIYSLREVTARGHAPWPDAFESKAFLGHTTLAGSAANLQRLQTWNESVNDRTIVEVDDHERSACAVPITRGNLLAGVLIVSSTQPDFFKDVLACQAVAEYALLMNVALADKDFYPATQLHLQPMPKLQWQREQITKMYVNRIIIYARKHAISRREAEQLVLRELEQEFVEEAHRSLTE